MRTMLFIAPVIQMTLFGLALRNEVRNIRLAVVAARQKDEATAGTLLKQAVALDRSYAQRAVEDLEFQDYAQGKVFKEALR